ncbi:Sporulation related domain-containing protein [Mariprofundus ferrinatatus]|uniref:Sporulation related domain-containing protein n=1 Tax=Mariprofundus ferrinatatus TaxID=1921087 RepID=A0A2K8LDB6_9PROT|nr:SPOR domain-containing protein [Mariprofundus ferrinatatus]ATX82894.1 Sporulation related domain-containing protein [Mariprofundus ferrinatatus]
MTDNGKDDGHAFDGDALKQALSEPLYEKSKATEEILEHLKRHEEFNTQDPDTDMEPRDMADDAAMESTTADDTPIIPNKEDVMNFSTAAKTTSSSPLENRGNIGISRVVMAVIILAATGFTASIWMTNQKIDDLKSRVGQMEARMNNSLAIDPNQAANGLPDQESEDILMQLASQIMENREAINALKQPVSEEPAQNSIDSEKTTAVSAISTDKTPPQQEVVSTANAETADAPAEKTTKPESKTPVAKSSPSTSKSASRAAGNSKQGWGVVITSLKNEAMADKELAVLLERGLQAEKHTVKVRGETFHQLRVGWFEQKEDAAAHLNSVVHGLGYKDAWITPTQQPRTAIKQVQ